MSRNEPARAAQSLLTEHEVAAFLKVDVRTVRYWRERGLIEAMRLPSRLTGQRSRTVRYSRHALDQFQQRYSLVAEIIPSPRRSVGPKANR